MVGDFFERVHEKDSVLGEEVGGCKGNRNVREVK